MAKKTTNKKVNVIKEEKDKEVSLDTEKTENVENTILDAEKKDSDIINEDAQKPTITSEEKVDQPKPIEDNVEKENSQSGKKNSADKINTARHKISRIFGYYWNGQLME